MMTCGSCGYVGEDLEFMPTTEGDYWCPRCELGPELEDEEDEDEEEKGQAAPPEPFAE